MRYKKFVCIFASVAMMCLQMCACGNMSKNNMNNKINDNTNDNTNDIFSDRDRNYSYSERNPIDVTLKGNSVEVNGKSVEYDDGVFTISDEGVYVLSGTLDDGMIRVDAPDEKVQLVLNGAVITNQDCAAIYVKQADKVFITTADGSDNELASGGEFVQIDDNNIDATIFSKEDLTLNGGGTLTISAPSGHGIVSKDSLKITSGEYNIDSSNHGITGKDFIAIDGGKISITSGEDGLHIENAEDNNEDERYVYIKSGELSITADDDGVHAGSKLVIDGGIIDIKESYEGLEALEIEINGGDIKINSKDDGINAASGTSTDEFDAPEKMKMPGDFEKPEGMEVSRDFEKPEGMGVPDDFKKTEGGQNGDRQGRDFGGRPDGMNGGEMGDMQFGVFGVEEGAAITINGGKIYVNAEGDGIDSNGTIVVTGGEIYVDGPTIGANGALDFGTSASITGGTVIAVGAAGMAENFTESSNQGTVMMNVGGEAGDVISITDENGKEVFAYTATKHFENVVFSSPEIQIGKNYNVIVNK